MGKSVSTKKHYRLVVGLLCAALTGCLNQDEVRLTPAHSITLKTAGIVNLLPQTPTIHYAARLITDSNYPRLVLDNFDVEATTQNYLRQRLQTRGFEPRPILVPNMIRAQVYASSWAPPNAAAGRTALLDLGRAARVDILVIVYHQLQQDFMSDSSEKMRGYGIFKKHNAAPYAYSSLALEVLNVKTGGVIGRLNAHRGIAIDASLWNAKYESTINSITPAAPDQQALQSAITTALEGSLLQAAQEVGLSN